jgi:hypothetical protein
MLLSRRLLKVLVLIVVAGTLVARISHKYVWIYLTRKQALRPLAPNLLSNPTTSSNPEVLLAEANRLAWLFNWPKAEPFYVRAEELFRKKADARNEIYARVGRIRTQAETMSWVDVSETLGQQLEIRHRSRQCDQRRHNRPGQFYEDCACPRPGHLRSRRLALQRDNTGR